MSWPSGTAGRLRPRAALEAELQAYAGKPVGVIVRTAAEMAEVVALNPFPDRAANFTVAIFLEPAPPPDALKNVKGQANEEMRLGAREIYVHYPDGMGRSKLRIPAARRRDRAQHEHRRQARERWRRSEERSLTRDAAPSHTLCNTRTAHSEPGDATNPDSDDSAGCDPSEGLGSPFKISADRPLSIDHDSKRRRKLWPRSN